MDAQKMETLETPNKILFIQTAFLGDAILSLPAVEVLKLKFPNSFLSVLCMPITREVFANSPFVDETIVFDKRNIHKSFFALLKFAKVIRNKNFDRIYSAHRSFRTSILVLLSEVMETFGFSNSSFSFVYKNLVEYNQHHHEVQRNVSLVSFPDEIENWRVLPKVKIDQKVKTKIEEILRDFQGKKKIVIAPGSIWTTKRYPSEKYSKIVKILDDLNFQIFLIGSNSDRELCESIKNKKENIVNFAGDFSFIETVELMSNCDLLISNDSAPTHMGMCASIPVLTIYCSTVPDFGFYPYNEFSEHISLNGLSCKPCGIHGHQECPLDHFKCGNDLDEELIIAKALEILNRREKYS